MVTYIKASDLSKILISPIPIYCSAGVSAAVSSKDFDK